MQVAHREQLLLNAALHADEAIALASWNEWRASIPLEEAPPEETRLLHAVYARLSKLKAPPTLPEKLRGNARAAFTQNMLHARECLPALRELSAECPVMALKGFAHGARYGTWSSRPMGDVDVLVELKHLASTCRHLSEREWTPKYGMTWAGLLHRSALKRDSWGMTRGHADLDLHWRLMETEHEDELERIAWSTAQTIEVLGSQVVIPSPEVALLASINHGFRTGTRADGLQTIVDSHAILKDCDPEALAMLLTRFGMTEEFVALQEILSRLGIATDVRVRPEMRGRKPRAEDRSTPSLLRPLGLLRSRRAARVPRARFEAALLNHPGVYRVWEAVGRPSLLERLLLRASGPMTRPLRAGAARRELYDATACTVMDEIGGVGWSWPAPEGDGFWSDRADARLLLPVRRGADHLLFVTFAEKRGASAAPKFDIFVNGRRRAQVDLRINPEIATSVVHVPRRIVFADWLEVSFRPHHYVAQAAAVLSYPLRVSVPLRRLEVVRLDERAGRFFDARPFSPWHERILKDEEPYLSKFLHIKAKIASSRFRESAELPEGFDPIRYVLTYHDLLMAEVDPFEHYLRWGRKEGRVWY